jgi:hypothetical protein
MVRTRWWAPTKTVCLRSHFALAKIRDETPLVIINKHIRSLQPQKNLNHPKTHNDKAHLQITMQHPLPMQILHPLRDLMHTPQQINLIPNLHTLQPSDQTPIPAIRTDEEPRRLPARAARSKQLQDVRMVEPLPDLDFMRE